MEEMFWSESTVNPRTSPPSPTIKNHSVTHFNGYLFCYGGYDGTKNHDTLLLYSITEEKWIRPHDVTPGQLQQQEGDDEDGGEDLSVANNNNNNNNGRFGNNIHDNNHGTDPSITVTGIAPVGRNGHSATLTVDPGDNENARIIIVGGWLGKGPLAAADMHVLDISNGGKTLRWHQPAVKGQHPGPCNMHSADYVPSKKEVYVFRGGNGQEYLNDLHALHAKTLTWRQVHTVGMHPQQRANHSSTLLEETEELFIFGGWNGTERLNDIHILDVATSTWTRPRAGGVLPRPRAGMTLTASKGRLFLFGGSGTSSKCFHDLQILDRQEMTWLDVTQHSGTKNDDDVLGSNNRGHSRFEGEPDNHNHNHHHLHHHRDGTDNLDTHMHDASDIDISDGNGQGYLTSLRSHWKSGGTAIRPRGLGMASPNPNDEDIVSSIFLGGQGPGRRAGHTATAVNRHIFIFGGSCGSDYLNDFYVLDTDPPPRARVTQANSLQLIEKRIRYFFNDEEFSDVTFIVQGQKVYGHKMILSIVSECFRAMFTSGFRESESLEIPIPDCSYTAFLAVMEYIYTGIPPKIDNRGDRESDLHRFVEILEVADRFFLDNLKQVCEILLQDMVDGDTADYLLQVSLKANAMQLQSVCEHFIRNRDAS